MAISSLIIILSSLTSALQFNFTSPDSVTVNDEFDVSISADTPDTYDVKVFIHNSSDSKITQSDIVSQIKFEDSWKNPWNYLVGAFPSQTTYPIKVVKNLSEQKTEQICVRLRKSGASSFSELCKEIEITVNERQEAEPNTEEQLDDRVNSSISLDSSTNQSESQNIISNNHSINIINSQIHSNLSSQPHQSEKIILNNKTTDAVNNSYNYSTKDNSLRNGLFYGFITFILLAGLIFLLRRLHNTNL